MFLLSAAAFAEGSLTIVASQDQLQSMDVLLKDLKDENVRVKILAPEAAAQAKQDDYLILVLNGRPSDPAYSALGPKILTDSDRKILERSGGKKLIVARDVWKNGQEVVCFAGNTDADAQTIRMETKGKWWDIVAGWFNIAVGGMHGY